MTRRHSLFIITLILALNTICYCFAQNTKELEYRICANDLLDISVYSELDLTKTVRVTADGAISYPLLGNISVKGLTAKELETKITELLAADYLVNPQVSVFIKEYAKISVLGQVRSPGAYELKTGLTVMDAIALAGGFTNQANALDVKLVRIKGNEKESISINANEVIAQGAKEKDIALEPGDLIVVGELSEASQYVLLLGRVRSPGRYVFKKGMTAIEAIALAGGLTETAAANGTKIIRTQNGEKTTIKVPVGSILQGGDKTNDVPLEPDDAIVVPESFF